ncbi:hypothetical protein MASR2M15_16300 [Anaerolineales bacterium]
MNPDQYLIIAKFNNKHQAQEVAQLLWKCGTNEVRQLVITSLSYEGQTSLSYRKRRPFLKGAIVGAVLGLLLSVVLLGSYGGLFIGGLIGAYLSQYDDQSIPQRTSARVIQTLKAGESALIISGPQAAEKIQALLQAHQGAILYTQT